MEKASAIAHAVGRHDVTVSRAVDLIARALAAEHDAALERAAVACKNYQNGLLSEHIRSMKIGEGR
jgi:hypothetical protein